VLLLALLLLLLCRSPACLSTALKWVLWEAACINCSLLRLLLLLL
jgi:hypothetical protein